MKQALIVFCVIAFFGAKAQTLSVNDVLNVERSFAAYSVAHGTKAAFLQFLDSSAVVFQNGKAVNGMEVWSKRKESSGVLNWHPVYGGIAASGDLGFTTGPWTYQPKSVDDSVAARGQYSTVWKKTKRGEWKAIVDIGIDQTPAFDDAVYKFKNDSVKFIPGTWNNLLNKEEKFAQQTANSDSILRVKIYSSFVSSQAFFLNRNNQLPATTVTTISNAVQSMPAQITYHIDGSGISTRGDLGYVYGTTTINGKADNYLRIWRRESKEWRLVLEVLRY